MDRDVATKGAAAIVEGKFTLEDFLEQLQQVRKMGSMSGVLSLLPGLSKEVKQASASIDDRQVDQVEAIIRSMTPGERADPAIIDGGRRVRIARGSGTGTSEVNALLKQFKEMQKMMKGFGKGSMPGGLGGLGGLFGRGAKLSPSAMAGLADAVGEDGELTAPLAGAAARSGGAPRSSKSKGKGGKKGKGGGRVTPKAR
jgi:signal recognition particle subunit SRP54